jgi:PA domain
VPLNANSARRVAGNVALIDRGGCDFTVKAKNAQDAGAVAVIIADNVAGSPPPELGGSDPAIRIPVVRVTQADGAALRDAANTAGNHPYAGAISVLFKNPGQLFGADRFGRPLLYTPSPYAPGSSVSHYDTSARPSLLMEPFDTGEESLAVGAPRDLTLELLRDIGW